jgi:hypothetical protein
MLRRFIIAIAIIAVLGISFKPTDASAHWRGGWGWGVGAGFLAGALIGGALARPYYYAPGPYYYAPGPYYYAPPHYYYGRGYYRYCWWRHGHRYCRW